LNSTFLDFKVFALDEETASTMHGQNQKGLLILAQAGENQAALQDFLQKILAAVKYDLEQDTLLIWLNEESRPNVASLLAKNKCKTLVAFGLVPEHLGIHFEWPLYYPMRLQNIQYLRADDLDAIFQERQQGGKKMSGALWKCLQDMLLL
jgi:hypothetical protein